MLDSMPVRFAWSCGSPRTRVFTVTEAAEVLGIGRSTAYEEARRFLETDGRVGLPCVRMGRRILVPHAALERFLGDFEARRPQQLTLFPLAAAGGAR